jgi:hypothetical protein
MLCKELIKVVIGIPERWKNSEILPPPPWFNDIPTELGFYSIDVETDIEKIPKTETLKSNRNENAE